MIPALLLLAFQPPAPLPQTAIFAFSGYGQKVDGSIGYGSLLSQASGTYSYTRMLYIPVRGQSPAPTLLTGVAVHLRKFGPLDAYGLAQGGATTTSSATVFSSALGGFVTIGTKWKWLKIAIGLDSEKSAGGQSFWNKDGGIIIIP